MTDAKDPMSSTLPASTKKKVVVLFDKEDSET